MVFGLHARNGILFGGIHHVGRPELLRPRELLGIHVDGDDLARAHHPRRLDRVEPDPAAAEHGHARSRRHLGPVEHGAGAREHAAAHEAREVEGRVLPDGDDAFLEQNGVGGVSRDLEEVMERLPVLAEARRAVEHEPPRLVAERAHGRLAADAVPAFPAGGDVARAHVIAGLDALHARPDLLDHAGRLVAEDDGERVRVVARHHVQVAVADAVGRPAHADLVRAGLQHLHVLDHQRLVHLVQHGSIGVHGHALLVPSLTLPRRPR